MGAEYWGMPAVAAARVAGRRRAWAARIFAAALAGALLTWAGAAVLHPYRHSVVSSDPVQRQLQQLTSQVQHLQQEENMPAVILNQSRSSVGYIYGEYSFSSRGGDTHATRFSGTGFVVGSGIIATNRHVAEPWYDDDDASSMMARGALPHLDKLIIFFPGISHPVRLTGATYSKDEDLAVLHFDPRLLGRSLRPLPIAANPSVPGDAVVLVGYPMGLTAMVAKSPNPVYRRLAYSSRDGNTARELAQLSLIRPSATIGHLGDVVDDKLIYDAVTAQGGSGGPVFNMRGEVIGVNAAYLDGFSGSTLGISSARLLPLVRNASQPQLKIAPQRLAAAR